MTPGEADLWGRVELLMDSYATYLQAQRGVGLAQALIRFSAMMGYRRVSDLLDAIADAREVRGVEMRDYGKGVVVEPLSDAALMKQAREAQRRDA